MNDNWLQHKNLLDKYLDILSSNPYINELKEDYDKLKIKRFLRHFNQEHTNWLVNLMSINTITDKYVTDINNFFDSKQLLNIFTNYITNNYTSMADLSKFFINKDNSMNEIFRNIKHTLPEFEFNPTKLKFVTTTAIAWIVNSNEDVHINFKEIYNKIKIADDILLVKKA